MAPAMHTGKAVMPKWTNAKPAQLLDKRLTDPSFMETARIVGELEKQSALPPSLLARSPDKGAKFKLRRAALEAELAARHSAATAATVGTAATAGAAAAAAASSTHGAGSGAGAGGARADADADAVGGVAKLVIRERTVSVPPPVAHVPSSSSLTSPTPMAGAGAVGEGGDTRGDEDVTMATGSSGTTAAAAAATTAAAAAAVPSRSDADSRSSGMETGGDDLLLGAGGGGDGGNSRSAVAAVAAATAAGAAGDVDDAADADGEELLGELLGRLTISAEKNTGQMSVQKQSAMHKRMIFTTAKRTANYMTLQKETSEDGRTIMLNLVDSILHQRKHQERVASHNAERMLAGGAGPWGALQDAAAMHHDTTASRSYGGAAAAGSDGGLGMPPQAIDGDDADGQLYTAHRSNGAYGSEDEEDA